MRRLASVASIIAVTIALLAVPAASQAAQGWTPPVTIEGVGENAIGYPISFASGPNAVVAATWLDTEGGYFSVKASVSSDAGLTWTTPIFLTPFGQFAREPHVAINDSGVVMVSWRYRSGSMWRVAYSTTADAGQTWSRKIIVSDDQISTTSPALLSVGSHGFAVFMTADNGGGYDLTSRVTTDDGVSWSSFNPITDDLVDTADVTASRDGLGNISAAWLTESAGHNEVESSMSVDGGFVWGSATSLEPGVEVVDIPQVVGLPGGGFITMWTRTSGGQNDVVTRAQNGQGAWGPVLTLATDVGLYPTPVISAGPGGSATAVWVVDDGVTATLRMSVTRDSGASWSSPADITQAPLNVDGLAFAFPRAVATAWGAVVVTWVTDIDQTNVFDVLQSRVSFDGGSTWSTVEDLSAAGALSANVVATSRGDVVVGWSQFSGYVDVPLRASTLLAPRLPDTGAPSFARVTGLASAIVVALGVALIVLRRRESIRCNR